MGARLRGAAICVLATGLLAGFGGSAQAAPTGQAACRESTDRTQYVAVLCGLDGELRGARLTLTGKAAPLVDAAERDDDRSDLRVAEVAGDEAEPLLPGETVTATWTTLRGSGRLRVRVADPLRARLDVTVQLHAGDRGARVAVAPDGTVTTEAGDRRRTIPVPALGYGELNGPELPWTATTPRQAVEAVLARSRRFGPAYMGALCAALESEVRASYDLAFTVPPRLDSFRPRCALLLTLNSALSDNSPRRVGTTGTVRSVRMLSADEAVVRVALRTRYARMRGERPYEELDSRVLVVREADGRWHLATAGGFAGSESLLATEEDTLGGGGTPARPGQTEGVVARLRAQRAVTRSRARSSQRRIDEVRARLDAATSPVADGPADCGTGRAHEVTDPARDGFVDDDGPTRDQELLLADVRAVRATVLGGRPCVVVRFERPPPARFAVSFRPASASIWPEGDTSTVRVIDGRAFLLTGWLEDIETLPGVQVTRDGAAVRILLPTAAPPAAAARWRVMATTAHPYGGDLNDDTPSIAQPFGGDLNDDTPSIALR